ncbi:MAG: hypothetical protein PHC69_13800 [Ruminiclostridium sp.]|nr:hypothetical protein [Ruminiclostridium sp.]
MEQSSYYKKYIILEELDSGFGLQNLPEGFIRLESGKDGIALSLQIKHLRGGTSPYTVIIVYNTVKETEIFRVGNFEVFNGMGGFRRNLDISSIQAVGLKPENIKYVLIASEHRDRVFIPLIGICSKTMPWDEAVRQSLLRKEKPVETKREKGNIIPLTEVEPSRSGAHKDNRENKFNKDNKENAENLVDDVKLEKKLKETFETIEPFSNPRHDYAWYRVNDIAKLSNLLFLCNMRVPLFANPKILVGLFKYRHILAGFYRSAHNDMNYFVLGVPAKDDSDGKPFENICRWVESQNKEYDDMKGYWLVYVNLKNGEFVN